MSQLVNVLDTIPGSGSSFEVDVGSGSLQENDLIFIYLSWRVSGTLAITGYTAIGTKQTTDAYDSQWFVKKAGVSESNPTASTTGAAASSSAVVVVMRGADSSGTALDSVDAHGNRAGATGATLTSADLTTTVDDCVILHGVTWDSTSVIAPLADMNRLASGSGCVGVTYKATAGAIPTFTFTGSNASNAGRAWAIAIKNASGGDKPVRLVDGRDYLQKLGGFATLTTGLPDSVTGLTQMDGVMMHTAANLSGGFGSFTLGTGIAIGSGWATPGSSFTSNQRCAVTAWVGTFIAVSSISVTGKIISIPWQVGTTGDGGRVGPKGYVITLVDSSNNWATYQVLPQKDWYSSRRGVLVIKPGTTSLLASSVTEAGSSGVACDFDDLVNVGYFYQRAALPTTDASVQWFCHIPIIENSVCAFVGGGSGIPVTTAIEARYLRGGNVLAQGCPEQVSFQGSGQLVNRIGLQLGDGSTATYSRHTAQSYDIPAPDESTWRVGTNGVPVIIKASSSDTHDLRSATFTSSILQPFTIDAASSLSATLLTTGLSVIGRTFSDLAGYDWTSVSWTECDTVTIAGGGDLTNCTISSTASTNAALSISDNGSVLDGCPIDGTGAAYVLELDTGVTAITLTDCTITAGSTDKVHVLKTLTNVAAGAFVVGVHYRINTVGTTDFTAIGASANTIGVNFTATGVGSGTGTADQAVKITISGTTSLAETDVTTAGAPAWVAAPQPTLDATVLASSRVVLYNNTTDAELDNTAPAGTSWSKVITSGASANDSLTLHVFKEGYQEFSTTFLYTGDDATILVTQAVHPHIASLRTELSITDYTTITEFAPDTTGHVYIEADDPDGNTQKARLAIWYNGILTTEGGARYFRGGMTILSTAAFRIEQDVVDILVENLDPLVPTVFTDTERRLYRADGTSIIAPTSYSVHNDYSGVPDTVETGVSGLTGSESAQLMALPSASTIASTVATQSQSTPFHADARKMNGATITGTGVDSDLWRGA